MTGRATIWRGQVRCQLLHDFRVVCPKICRFFGIVVEIVELNRWEILLDGGGLIQWTPAAGTSAKQQLSFSLANCEVPRDGMVDNQLMQRPHAVFAAQCGKQADAVFRSIG